MRTVDLRNSSKTELLQDEIPNDTEVLLASHNEISEIDFRFFFKNSYLWEIDLSHNNLKDLSFLKPFKTLGFLDISANNIGIEQLLDLRQTIILRINLSDNRFDSVMQQHPLFIPTLLSKSWIIDDHFITDFERGIHRKYIDSLEFGSILLSSDGLPKSKMNHESYAQAGKLLVQDHDFQLSTGGIALSHPRGGPLYKLDTQGQFERLSYLRSVYPFELPRGSFIDYFGLAAAILAKIWIGQPLDTIPRLLCRAYWFGIGDDVSKMKEYELMVLLCTIFSTVKPTLKLESEMWSALNVERFVKIGKVPMIGSTPRMIVTALIARAIAASVAEPSDDVVRDLRAYFKFRKACGFTNMDSSLEAMHEEFVAPFYQPDRVLPQLNDVLELVHPVTGEWVQSKVLSTKNGRVFATVDDVIAQIPASSTFWDGRGVWREAAQKEKLPRIGEHKEATRTFITAADLIGETGGNEKLERLDLSKIGQSFAPPAASARVAPANRVVFLEIGREAMRTTFAAKEVEVDESKFMKGWRTFRGIVEPPFPRPERTFRSPRNYPRKTQVVENVVNVTPGKEYEEGKHYRRFNVRLKNRLTGKSEYSWLTEEELSPPDVEVLMARYREHIASKMDFGEDGRIPCRSCPPRI